MENGKNWLPQHYYSIHRAASELNCEEDDLWHLVEAGNIELCVNLRGRDATLVLDGGGENKTIDVFRNDSFQYFLDEKLASAKFKRYGEDLHAYEFNKNIYMASIHGLWRVDNSCIERVMKSGSSQESKFLPDNYAEIVASTGVLVFAMSVDSFFSLPSMTKRFPQYQQRADSLEVTRETLFLSRREFVRVQSCLNGGDRAKLLNYYSDNTLPELHEKSLKQDKRGAHFAFNREMKLMALAYVYFNHNSEIMGKRGRYTMEAHAQATIDHWAKVGGNDEEPTMEHLLGLLRDAKKLPEERKIAGKPKTKI